MTRFVTVAGMKAYEAYLAAGGISYRQMMEEAGRSAAQRIMERWPPKGRRVVVLCGKGNNGGDGFVVARRLAEEGAVVTVALVCGPPATPESKAAFGEMPPGVRVVEDASTALFPPEAELVVDGIFGTGFTGRPPEEVDRLFRLVRQSGIPVAALDIPSGVESDTGRWQSCIPAALTVALGGYKPAHLVNWAAEYAGEIVMGGIGASREEEDRFPGWLEAIDSRWFWEHRPRRSHTGHKGDNGRLLLVAGSRQYPGAAMLAATAAVRSGVGYARLASTSRVCKIVAGHCPEVIYTICPKNQKGGIDGGEQTVSALLGAAQGVNAIALGCGMEPGPDTLDIVRAFLRQEKPLLLDAGAITALGEEPDPIRLLREAACPVVLTPHPGEYARLTGTEPGEVGNNPFAPEHTMGEGTKITLLRKGYVTGIFQGERRVWHFGGCDGLAKGGSGDVLTGIIGGLLAQGAAPWDAARAGVWLHGRAARLCARDHSRRGMVPSQLADYLGAAFLEAEQEEG